MNADEYKNYILGFIFYKYLSERLESYVDEKLLHNEKLKFRELTTDSQDFKEILEEVKRVVMFISLIKI